MRTRVLVLFVALSMSEPSCGYQVTARGTGAAARAIRVGRIIEPGIDVDAAAMVAGAVRQAIARGPSTRLVRGDAAEAELEVELVNSASALATLADPGLRAAQYRAVVLVRGRLLDKQGKVLWTSTVITGEAPYLSAPGPIEALDGARRRALERAADDAAERLVASMSWREGA